MKRFDPRTKLVLILAISVVALICDDMRILGGTLLAAVLLVLLFCGGVCLLNAMKKMRGIFFLFCSIAVVQSLFTPGEHPLLQVGGLKLLSMEGITLGILFFLRIATIMIAAVMVATEDSGRTIQALVQSGLPYEIAFMCVLAIRFIPVFGQELRSSLVSIQLRGVDLKRIPLGKRVRLYTSLLMPVVTGMLQRAKTMAAVMEMRGFRAYDTRTGFFALRLEKPDVAVMVFAVAAVWVVLRFYFR